jgi:hypothetical protein
MIALKGNQTSTDQISIFTVVTSGGHARVCSYSLFFRRGEVAPIRCVWPPIVLLIYLYEDVGDGIARTRLLALDLVANMYRGSILSSRDRCLQAAPRTASLPTGNAIPQFKQGLFLSLAALVDDTHFTNQNPVRCKRA